MTSITSHASSLPQAAGPLANVRILDMATVVAAPFSSSLCADLGAQVVKLELPGGGDALRSLAPVKGEHALYWKVLNRGKRGISLDVRKPEGRDLLLKMLPEFDVLVENFRTGTMDAWGLDIKTLHAVNPRLIVLRLTGFGQTGPYAQRPGFARVFEAMSGFANLTGEADGSPQHMNFPLGDVAAGLFGAFSIASALVEQKSLPGTPGREIDLSATEAMIRLLEPLAVEFEQLGVARERAGSRATYTAPSNMYKTQDGAWLTVVGSSGTTFARLCQAMGRPELPTDPRFATNADRMKNVEQLDGLIAAWCGALSTVDVSAKLDQFQVPFSKIYNIEDVLNDAHFQSRKVIVRLPDPELGSIPAPCTVPRFVGFESPVPRTGPAPGEHNAQVYGAFGLDEASLKVLRDKGVI